MQVPSTTEHQSQQLTITSEYAGKRLDVILKAHFDTYSREQLASFIKQGMLKIDDKVSTKPSFKPEAGQHLNITLPLLVDATLAPYTGTDLDIPLLFEDDAIVVLDKPAGLPTHPQQSGVQRTLANWLAARYGGELPCPDDDPLRAGIVHRLDADTSGVIVCAKTQSALEKLKAQFRERAVSKTYVALVHGLVTQESFTIDAPLERDPQRPVAVRVNKTKGRPAQTDFTRLETFEHAEVSLVKAHPLTGRTHQIRVHLHHAGHPVVADHLYSPHKGLEIDGSVVLARHALHAEEIELSHPISDQKVRYTSPLATDIQAAIEALRNC